VPVPDEPCGRLTDAWRFCVGTGRFELALRQDYQESLALVQRDIGFRQIRGHGLLSDGVGIHRPYEYRGSRHVRHAFTYVDQIVDAYLDLGVAPFVELGFMPSGLASGSQTVFWWGGNVTPPRSWTEWADLVRATVAHLVDRYGRDRVRDWPIEVWNEPNLKDFWRDADRDAYHRLYEVTAHSVKEVDASLRVGGPAISPGADDWLAWSSSPRRGAGCGAPPWPTCRCTSPSSTPRTGRTTRSTTRPSTRPTSRPWWRREATWWTLSRTGRSATCSRRWACRRRCSTAGSAC